MASLLTVLPYIAILLANLFYLYTISFNEQTHWFSIFLFNFAIMVFAGIFITLHINILLHKWIVEESDKPYVKDGKLTKKQLIQNKIKSFLNFKYFLQDLFLPGNQVFLLKLYLGMAVFRWVVSFIPGILAGLFLGLYFQYKKPIYQRFKSQFDKIGQLFDSLKNKVLEVMPRYKGIKIIKSNTKNSEQTANNAENKQVQESKNVKIQ